MTNEVKHVTCAVRLDKPLYDKLVEVSQKSHKTLSEVIRAGIIKELELLHHEVLEKELAMTKLEEELMQVRKLKEEMEAMLAKRTG